MAWSLLLPLLSAALLHHALGQTPVSVTTKKGLIVGMNVAANAATTNIAFDAFLGIPYGNKPDRFQLANARTAWTDPLTTQVDGPLCPQPGVTFSEDCLYLNVFTPSGASATASTSTTKLPVMAYVPGGAFIYSDASSKIYGPDFLVSEGVILVTINYRVGATGFLSLGSKVAPGNLGLHDTLLALQWIQDEISAFGGDPAQVTLVGQSAGSVITHIHYLSPLSTGMFKRAIGHSGSVLADWSHVTGTEAKSRALLLAQKLKCDTSQTDATILACLQKAEINDIVGNQNISLSNNDVLFKSRLPFVPVMDSNSTADKPFFPDSLDILMKAAVTRAKPLISGITSDEGILMFSSKKYLSAEANLAAFLPEGSRNSDNVNSIKTRYFNQTATLNKVQSLVSLYTDYLFGYPAAQVSRAFADFTYGYVFAFDGTWISPPLAGTSSQFSQYNMRGVTHSQDLAYLFYSSLYSVQSLNTCAANIANVNMKNNMVKWWTTFAKTGVPDNTWQTISKGGYLVINSQTSFKTVATFESQYYDFWASMQRTSTSSAALTKVSLLTLFLSLSAVIKRLYL